MDLLKVIVINDRESTIRYAHSYVWIEITSYKLAISLSMDKKLWSLVGKNSYANCENSDIFFFRIFIFIFVSTVFVIVYDNDYYTLCLCLCQVVILKYYYHCIHGPCSVLVFFVVACFNVSTGTDLFKQSSITVRLDCVSKREKTVRGSRNGKVVDLNYTQQSRKTIQCTNYL